MKFTRQKTKLYTLSYYTEFYVYWNTGESSDWKIGTLVMLYKKDFNSYGAWEDPIAVSRLWKEVQFYKKVCLK